MTIIGNDFYIIENLGKTLLLKSNFRNDNSEMFFYIDIDNLDDFIKLLNDAKNSFGL